MPRLNCKICSNEFYAKPRHIKMGWGKYCSKKCQSIGQRTGKHVICSNCGKDVYRIERDLRRSESKQFFCNKSCFAIWKNTHLFCGEQHANWKNGETTYRAIMIRAKIKQICNVCKNDDKRVLAVHHKDKNRKNNSINNLIWLCMNCHHLVHKHKQELKSV